MISKSLRSNKKKKVSLTNATDFSFTRRHVPKKIAKNYKLLKRFPAFPENNVRSLPELYVSSRYFRFRLPNCGWVVEIAVPVKSGAKSGAKGVENARRIIDLVSW